MAIVHQGGIGTTAQALRSGRPMLIMPYSIDQPDNAARAERLGVARTIKRTEYNAVTAAAELKQLLNNPKYTEQATKVGQQIQLENGVKTACNAIEARSN
jgi:UDP:flavonoid glycosyltransferase YjiC (YdhE family)